MHKVDLFFSGFGLQNVAPDKCYRDKRPTHKCRIRCCEDPPHSLCCTNTHTHSKSILVSDMCVSVSAGVGVECQTLLLLSEIYTGHHP